MFSHVLLYSAHLSKAHKVSLFW